MNEAWKSIETAPRDGSHFLTYGPYGYDVMNWPVGCGLGRWDMYEKQWAGYITLTNNPSHWTTLPEPPENKI